MDPNTLYRPAGGRWRPYQGKPNVITWGPIRPLRAATAMASGKVAADFLRSPVPLEASVEKAPAYYVAMQIGRATVDGKVTAVFARAAPLSAEQALRSSTIDPALLRAAPIWSFTP